MLASLTKYAVALSAYGAGLLANWYFLRFAAMQNMAARWVVAFALGYAVFIGAVRLYCGARTTMRLRVQRSKDGESRLSGVPAIRALDEGAALLVAIVVALVLSVVGLGASLVYLLFRMPALLSDAVHPSIVAFVVIYGLDWVATVPPTVALCRSAFGERGTVVFGWVFASHQIGAAVASVAAGFARDRTGTYTVAWFSAALLCVVAAVISVRVSRDRTPLAAR